MRDKEEAKLVDAIHDKLVEAGMARKPGTNEFSLPKETTVSINGGPVMPVEDFVAATDRLVDRSNSGTVAADQLRQFIERVERLAEEKQAFADDIKDVFSEAKASGYDTKIMRLLIRLRKMESEKRQEQAAMLETYADAIGLQHALPL